jgi:diguanylate cyclase (GGDEF)-like protein
MFRDHSSSPARPLSEPPAFVRGGRDRRAGGFGRAALLLVGMWMLGLIALGAIVGFERRVDESRHAQVVIEQLRNESGALLQTAFDPATVAKSDVPDQLQTKLRLAQEKSVFNASLATLARLDHGGTPAQIAVTGRQHFRFVDQLSALVAANHSARAALELGKSHQPGGIEARLDTALARANARYGSAATQSRTVASIGTVIAILFLLVAFTIVFQHSVRARQRSHSDATTDALTGLGNRRKLFADMNVAMTSLRPGEKVAVGIFDLDGFKTYNDAFGHPAGDSLLALLGHRLGAVVGSRGRAYRIGGDEFVVATRMADSEALLSAAQAALSERGEAFVIGCSRGSTSIAAGLTLEDALHIADQRLYANKRALPGNPRSEAKDALLQVLAEQDHDLITHLGHVAELATGTAIALGLSSEQVERTRLAAEMHDIGKSAIPASILDKPGPLDTAERALVERHTVIGERILAAAPTLRVIAPIVRASHERPDGTGYPDGLQLEEIPICARIIAVVDAYDAMTSDRAYRRAMPLERAIDELHRHAGTQFDADVVDALVVALKSRQPLALAA